MIPNYIFFPMGSCWDTFFLHICNIYTAPWALVGWALVGPPRPLWAPWALVDRALGGSLVLLWAGPLWAFLGRCGPGPCGLLDPLGPSPYGPPGRCGRHPCGPPRILLGQAIVPFPGPLRYDEPP